MAETSLCEELEEIYLLPRILALKHSHPVSMVYLSYSWWPRVLSDPQGLKDTISFLCVPTFRVQQGILGTQVKQFTMFCR